jgi:hypothetical protein
MKKQCPGSVFDAGSSTRIHSHHLMRSTTWRRKLFVSVSPSEMISLQEPFVSRLFEVIGDETLVRSLLDSRPRPFPTTKPMDPKARHKLALWGRRFEIQQLLVDVDKCDCCGIVMPYAADDWLQSKSIEGNSHFRRLHLLKRFKKSYRIFKCDCANICKGGQFWCLRRPAYRTHREAFEQRGYTTVSTFVQVVNLVNCALLL